MVLQTVAAGISAGGIGFSSIFPTLRGQRHGGVSTSCSLISNVSSNCKIHLWKKQQASKKPKHVVQAGQDQRRSAGFLPTVWDPELIMSSTTAYQYEDHAASIEELEQDVKSLLESAKCDPHLGLKLIDDIQRLGLPDCFGKEIKDALNNFDSSMVFPDDLYTTSLQFRLLRQNGFPISSDVFNKFLDKNGEFMDNFKEDAKGLLSLYEASYLDQQGEHILEKAKNFSSNHLKSLSMENLEPNLSQQIQRSLESPLYQRLPWVETRNFINIYQFDTSRNSNLLKLAKLNYNMVQSIYLEELKELAGWWKDLNFKETYPFCRDRLVECYFFAMAFVPRPELSKCRKITAKWATLTTVLDDIYDVYGSLDELEKLTQAFRRFDRTAVKDIPEYMRPCYLAHYENAMEMVEIASNNSGVDIHPYFKKHWVIYVETYMKEAQWLHSGYMPTFDEYLENGLISIASPLAATHSFLGSLGARDVGPTEQLLQWIQRPDSELLYLNGIIGRLYNDLKFSKVEMERGEEVNAITCYMIQEEVSEEEARNQLERIISDTWTKLNDLTATKSLPATLSDIALNGARCWQEIYSKGDWFAGEGLPEHKSSIILSYFEPIM